MTEHYNIDGGARHRVVYRKAARIIIEYTPALCIVLELAVLMGWLAGGMPEIDASRLPAAYRIAGVLMSAAWALFAFLASLYFGLCNLHRAMIVYIYASAVLLHADRWHAIGTAAPYVLGMLLLAGIIILAIMTNKIWYKLIPQRSL